MNGPQSRPPVTGPESGVTNEIPRRGKSRTGKASASTKQSNEQLLTEATQAQQFPEGTQKQKKDVSSAGSAHCQIKFPDVAQTAQLLVKKIG